MICRRYDRGQTLDVAGLNRLRVIIDRSETARTEVALNIWPAGLLGPPHRHEQKEQTFFVTAGSGRITVGDQTRPVSPGDVVFVPAGVEHRTVAGEQADLEYVLFNAFLSDEKEGHGTFAEHVEQVKAVRREQADRAAIQEGRKGP